MQAIGQVGQAQGLGAVARGQSFAALESAVGYGHGLRFARRKVGGDEFDHLARTYEQHLDLAQVFEQLRGQAYRGRGHADRMGANLGLGAHFLGHRERALEHLVQRGTQGAGGVGLAHGLLHLAEDLRLAQHHGVQPAGHAEGVPGCLAALTQVGMVLQLARNHTGVAGQEFHGWAGQLLGRRGSVGRHVQLGAVAGGHQRGLGRRALQALAQGLEHGAQLVGRKGQTAPQIQRCGGVVQA